MGYANYAIPPFDEEEFGKVRKTEKTITSAPPAEATLTDAERAELDAD